MIAIARDFNDSKSEDLKTFKARARNAEAERDELKQVLDSGENTSKKKVEKLLAENERLKSLADAHLSEKKQLWKDMAEKIPEPMKKFFKFAEKDKELTDEETLSNVSKLREYTDIGAIKIDGGPPAPNAPNSPPGGGKQRVDTKAWENLTPSEKIKFGYREEAKKAG
jgi:flagellar biosynthesis GTPase FlhF